MQPTRSITGGMLAVAAAPLMLSVILFGALTDSAVAQDDSIEHAKSLSRAFRNAAEVPKPTVVTITPFVHPMSSITSWKAATWLFLILDL